MPRPERPHGFVRRSVQRRPPSPWPRRLGLLLAIGVTVGVVSTTCTVLNGEMERPSCVLKTALRLPCGDQPLFTLPGTRPAP